MISITKNILAVLLIICAFGINASTGYLIDKEQLAAKTPEQALNRLKAGNKRFVSGNLKEMDLLKMVKKSNSGQYPAAIVLSCIDSRVPVEIVFDQGLGNVFVARTAGNVLSNDTIAGLEYATKVVGSKLIVVMGHEECGAVGAACKGVKLGHITELLDKIQPAVTIAKKDQKGASCDNNKFINHISAINARHVANEVVSKSPIIQELVKNKEIKIVSAIYHTDSGEVEFFDVPA